MSYVTQDELQQIQQEYIRCRKLNQKDMSINEDGTYSLPMNYPMGLADIEEYRDLSNYPGGKENFRKQFARIQRLYFIGEHEGRITGNFAYETGKTNSGIQYESGDRINTITGVKDKYGFEEIEWGPMHTIGDMQATGIDGKRTRLSNRIWSNTENIIWKVRTRKVGKL